MSKFVLFKPLSKINAEKNFTRFIDLCKNELTVFGKNICFDDYVWDLTGAIHVRGKTHSRRIYFSDWESADTSNTIPMPEPFCSFAKSYVRYQHGFRPVIDITARIVPLRSLEFAMQDMAIDDLTQINSNTFNRASQLLKSHYCPERAYRLGQNLEAIAKFMDENRLNNHPLRWKNPIARPCSLQKIGKDFDERRQKKLPSAYNLEMLATAFRSATSTEDVIITSISAIMCATPDRISEIITLPHNCEHNGKQTNGDIIFGLRYWPAKGGEPMIKWVVHSMTDVIIEAIARIKKHTEGPRELAHWYEANPTKLYLTADLEHLRGFPLSYKNISDILWGDPDDATGARGWVSLNRNKFGLKIIKRGLVDFISFENAIINLLPKYFPFTTVEKDGKISDLLCLAYRNQFNQQRRTIICCIETVTHGHIEYGLGSGLKHGKSSVFSRLDIVGEKNEPIVINTHQFRHYLNTLALRNGLDEIDVSKWSGRKDVSQTKTYDHRSKKDTLALIRDAIGDHSKMFGPLSTLPKSALITRDEFARLVVTSAHTTEFGYCIHDYVMSPCALHLDCLNCNELVCIKGDSTREINILRQADETRELLARANLGAANGHYGADRWIEHQTKTLQRLDELTEILSNPLVQMGAVIQLKHVHTASKLVNAAQKQGIVLNNSTRNSDYIYKLIDSSDYSGMGANDA